MISCQKWKVGSFKNYYPSLSIDGIKSVFDVSEGKLNLGANDLLYLKIGLVLESLLISESC